MTDWTIIYKSGVKVHVSAEDLQVSYRTVRGEMAIVRFSYQSMEPYPLYSGIEDIAAIWQGHV